MIWVLYTCLYVLVGITLFTVGHITDQWSNDVYTSALWPGLIVLAWPLLLVALVLYGAVFGLGLFTKLFTRQVVKMRAARVVRPDTDIDEQE